MEQDVQSGSKIQSPKIPLGPLQYSSYPGTYEVVKIRHNMRLGDWTIDVNCKYI